MTGREELYRNLLIKKKKRGLEDLFFFNKYILESEKKRRDLLVKHVHQEWTDWYYASKSRIKMILVPRSCFKSTFFTVGRTIQALCQDRDNRVLIANANLNNAQKFLSEMKDHLRKNDELIRLYGEFYDKGRWNLDEFDVLGKGLGIKEASVTAVGVGGNLVSQHYCLYPETKVLTSNGYKEAKSLRKGLRVLSHDGKFHSIKAVSKSFSDEKVSIRPQYQAEYSNFSPNHRIYVYRNGNFEWIRAGDVVDNDKLCVPISKYYNRQPSKVNKRINKLFAELDIWRLIGYWLAEGCHTPEGGQIRLTFSDKEISFVNDVENIVRKHLKVPVSHRRTKSSTFIVCFSDNDFKEILNKFGTKSYTKHIPPFAINNYSNRQRELILGYFRGDGCYCNGIVSFSSTSLDLLSGIQLMLAKHGIASGIAKGNREGNAIIMGKKVHVRDSWTLSSTSYLLKSILGLETRVKFPVKPTRSFFTDRFWVVPIQDVKTTEEKSVTYDIQVAETETLYCQGMVVHNSKIICDDLVNLENSSTRYQSDKVIDWWKRAFSLLDYDGEMIIIGTRWSYYELYSWIVEKYGEKVDTYIRGAYNPDGSLYFPELLSEEKLAELKALQGSYIFCNPKEAPVLMADWTFKPIGEVKAGDEVVGWKVADSGRRALCPSKVLETGSRKADIVKMKMESGREVRCTPNHKWYTARLDKTHREYKPANLGSRLMFVLDPNIQNEVLTEEQKELAIWFGGLYDGDGGFCGSAIFMAQDRIHNPEVCERIEYALDKLGFNWNQHTRKYKSGVDARGVKRSADMQTYWLNGGLEDKIRFLNICNPSKKVRIIPKMFNNGGRFIKERDKVIDIVPDGNEKVFALKTETENYIVWGYASSNSAFYLNDPVDEDSALIKRSSLKYWGEGDEKLPRTLNIFAVCDPAVSQAVKADESSIVIVGVDSENSWWVLETRSGRWTTGELIEQLFAVKNQWRPITMTIEVIGQAQGIMMPIHAEENRRNDFLPLYEIVVRPPVKKEMRIRSVLQPRFERGKVFIKRDMFDLEEQILKFPKGKRDDMIDAMTDIEEISYSPDLPVEPFKSSGSHLQDLLNKEVTVPPKFDDPFLGGYY